MPRQAKVYYVTKEQYDTLYHNGQKDGSFEHNGVTYTYDENAIYYVPEETKIQCLCEKMAYEEVNMVDAYLKEDAVYLIRFYLEEDVIADATIYYYEEMGSATAKIQYSDSWLWVEVNRDKELFVSTSDGDDLLAAYDSPTFSIFKLPYRF
jgi:hypothetical protein